MIKIKNENLEQSLDSSHQNEKKKKEKGTYHHFPKMKTQKGIREKFESLLDPEYLNEGKAIDDPFRDIKQKLQLEVIPSNKNSIQNQSKKVEKRFQEDQFDQKTTLQNKFLVQNLQKDNQQQNLQQIKQMNQSQIQEVQMKIQIPGQKFQLKNSFQKLENLNLNLENTSHLKYPGSQDSKSQISQLISGSKSRRNLQMPQSENQNKRDIIQEMLTSSTSGFKHKNSKIMGSTISNNSTKYSNKFLNKNIDVIPQTSPLIEQKEAENVLNLRKTVKQDPYAQMYMLNQQSDLHFQTDILKVKDSLGNYSSFSEIVFQNEHSVKIKQDDLFKIASQHINSTKPQHQHLNKILKNPNERDDIYELKNWLNQMLHRFHQEQNNDLQKTFDQIQIIFHAGLKEIVRQVKLDCLDRGELLEKIWDSYTSLVEKSVQQVYNQKNTEDFDNLYQTRRIHEMYQSSYKEAEKIKQESQEKLKNLREQMDLMQKSERYLKIQYIKLQDYSRNIRRDLEGLQREYRLVSSQKRTLKNAFDTNPLLKALMELQQYEWNAAIDQILKSLAGTPLGIKLTQIMNQRQQTNESGNVATNPDEEALNEIDIGNRKVRDQPQEFVNDDDDENVINQFDSANEQFDIYLKNISTDCIGLEKDTLDQEIQTVNMTKTKNNSAQTDDVNISSQNKIEIGTQTTELDPEQFEEMKGIKIESLEKIKFDLEGHKEDFEDVIANFPNLTTSFKLRVHTYIQYLNLENRKIEDIMRDEMGLKQNYYNELIEFKLGFKEQENELLEIREKIQQQNIQMEQNNEEKEILEKEVIKLREDILELREKFEQQQKQQQDILKETSKATELLANSPIFQEMMNGRRISFEEGDPGYEEMSNNLQKFNRVINKLKTKLLTGGGFQNESENLQNKEKKLDVEENFETRGRSSTKKQIKAATTFFKPKQIAIKQKQNLFQNNSSSISASIIQKLQKEGNLDKCSLPKKTVLKLISQVYQEKLKNMQASHMEEMNLQTLCFEMFLKQYGMKNIAEKKMQQLIESLLFYKQNFRVALFGRFINLFEPLSEQYLGIYLKKFKDIQIEETLEGCLISAEKCLEFIMGIQNLRADLIGIAQSQIQDATDPKNKIDFDHFMLIYFDIHINSNSDDKEWISNLFNILDFNQDGMMEMYEFMTSVTYIMNIKDSAKLNEIEQLFNNKSDLFNQKGEKCMSEQVFTQFCLELDLFRKPSVSKLIEEKGLLYPQLKLNWKEEKQQIKMRFYFSSNYNTYFQNGIARIEDNLNQDRGIKQINDLILIIYYITNMESRRSYLNQQIEDCLVDEFIEFNTVWKEMNLQEIEYKDLQDKYFNNMVAI